MIMVNLFMEITSLNNEKVKFWQKLQHKKYRDANELFLVEDDHLIKEALKRKVVVEIITIDKNAQYDLPTYYVTSKIINLLSKQVTGAKTIAVCHFLESREVKGNVIVLDDIQDPGNLGTIIRSAVAFNFDTLFLSNNSVDLYNPKSIRASEGMFFHLNVLRGDIEKFLKSLDNSYLKITTDVQNGQDIKDVSSLKYAIVIGNEGKGVSKAVATLCNQKVLIKMQPNCESLNAGVAASILMYEVNHE